MNENSFYSIDRLIEFGMGMAMAQQMIGMMNETMKIMYVPGSPSNMMSTTPFSIYVGINNQTIGPLDEKDFAKLAADKKIDCSTLVWMPGMTCWKPIEQVPNALRIIALTPPPLPNI